MCRDVPGGFCQSTPGNLLSAASQACCEIPGTQEHTSQRPCLSLLGMEVAARTRYEHMHLLRGVLRRADLTQQPMHRSRSALPRGGSGAACRPEMNLAQPRWLQHAHAVRMWCMLAPCSYLELGDNSMCLETKPKEQTEIRTPSNGSSELILIYP